jgi:hypothetical protein
MRIFLFILLISSGLSSYANMASPFKKGTRAATVLTSKDIDILKEKLSITINKDFSTAYYIVEYTINTEKEGKQIPLLFLAKDFKEGFKIFLDDKEISLSNIPENYLSPSNSPFSGFSSSFNDSVNAFSYTEIKWDEKSSESYKFSDLKYFEVDLAKGKHTIRVEYIADAWSNRSGWVKDYSYHYSLSPAKYWRSFGELEVVLNGTLIKGTLNTNIGKPNNGSLDSIAVWHFTKLPADFLKITCTPEISSLAKRLLYLGPRGITLIIALILILLHIIAIKRFRLSNPSKPSWVVIVGSILLPLLVFFIFLYSFGLIDKAIGPAASHYHGYAFMAIVFYPVVMPVYWLVMWLLDKAFKKKNGSGEYKIS